MRKIWIDFDVKLAGWETYEIVLKDDESTEDVIENISEDPACLYNEYNGTLIDHEMVDTISMKYTGHRFIKENGNE